MLIIIRFIVFDTFDLLIFNEDYNCKISKTEDKEFIAVCFNGIGAPNNSFHKNESLDLFFFQILFDFRLLDSIRFGAIVEFNWKF